MDAWFEEDEEVFTHPRDPYTRVDILPSSRHVRVEVDGVTVAESTSPRLLFETGLPVRYYLPKTHVRLELLERTDTVSHCPYKGEAEWWSVRIGDEVHEDLPGRTDLASREPEGRRTGRLLRREGRHLRRRRPAGPPEDEVQLSRGVTADGTDYRPRKDPRTMHISDSTPVVTGAGRGLGRHLVDALVERGAAKVYGLARDTSRVRDDERVVPVRLRPARSREHAGRRRGGDGRHAADQQRLDGRVRGPARGRSEDLRREMAVNFDGTYAAIRAFAPVLEATGVGRSSTCSPCSASRALLR